MSSSKETPTFAADPSPASETNLNELKITDADMAEPDMAEPTMAEVKLRMAEIERRMAKVELKMAEANLSDLVSERELLVEQIEEKRQSLHQLKEQYTGFSKSRNPENSFWQDIKSINDKIIAYTQDLIDEIAALALKPPTKMRLINTQTLEFEEFVKPPRYAILSHTWEAEEVSYRDFLDIKTGDRWQQKGFEKIIMTCKQAQKDDFLYVWIDTCCIDKSSSAELSEAINSMFKWYRQSAVCYAYLADVPEDGDHRAPESAFSRSRWFTRGWTLQELIAPMTEEFFGKNWIWIGDKKSLELAINKRTRIDVEILRGGDLKGVSVARRMSWASDRETTREEDIAYCLMGIFDINMPMLYGEGTKAFIRLQEHILNEIGDESMFAWKAVNSLESARYRGIFADSPAEFRDSAEIVPCFDITGRPAPVISSKGVSLLMPHSPMEPGKKHLHPSIAPELVEVAKASMSCCMAGDDIKTMAVEVVYIRGEGRYYRSSPSELFRVDPFFNSQTVYFPKSAHEFSLSVTSSTRSARFNGFLFEAIPPGFEIERPIPHDIAWSPHERIIYWRSLVGGSAGMVLTAAAPGLLAQSERILIVMWANPKSQWEGENATETAG
ncbi:heterokaryon incompatibility protein-domain-containing protein [Cladorrhinum sp. PSN259]|nr:heterokaryon incompatibility protein-domain-containing protein [Cladorrhinum sp. PSN259]